MISNVYLILLKSFIYNNGGSKRIINSIIIEWYIFNSLLKVFLSQIITLKFSKCDTKKERKYFEKKVYKQMLKQGNKHHIIIIQIKENIIESLRNKNNKGKNYTWKKQYRIGK